MLTYRHLIYVDYKLSEFMVYGMVYHHDYVRMA